LASAEYADFEVYAKRVFFANGIHHHYSNMASSFLKKRSAPSSTQALMRRK
jgi:hypothetical protein